jgi:formylglycine-generating enzyme required for sulfatase activity
MNHTCQLRPQPQLRYLVALIVSFVAASSFGQDSPLENGIGMKFVRIPPGEFEIGNDVKTGEPNFNPKRAFKVESEFYMSIFEVRLADFIKVTGRNPFDAVNQVADCPVLWVSWDDCQDFCKALSNLDSEKAAGREYRLPTEKEWEYACRAGSKTDFNFGDNVQSLDEYAWTQRNSKSISPTGRLKPNAFGLFDMHGNAWEWCQDDYFYRVPPAKAKHGAFIERSSRKVVRGGSWDSPDFTASSSYRFFRKRESRDNYTGFRVVLEVRRKNSENP